MNKKPQMLFNFRMSIDSSGKQRYTEEDIKKEFKDNNVKIERTLLIRKKDGAVLGEFLL